MLKIGNLRLKSNLILAPMAGISDFPFRMINRKFGCELAFVEMINCRSISHKSKRTAKMLASSPGDRPLGVQLLGCEVKYVSKALDALAGHSFELLDFNAACPAKKVVRRGEGAGLLKEPKKVNEILKVIVDSVKMPVTVKIRIGWDKDSVNAPEVALAAQDAGVSAVFIHGRTKTQGYSGGVDYRAIREVKEALSVPLIASGDVFSPLLAKKMLDETGADGLIIARGALGNPWIFKEVAEFLKSGKAVERPTPDEIAEVMLEHLEMNINFYGQRNGVVIFRKFFSWYTKGFRKIRPLREKVSRVKTQEEMVDAIKHVSPLS
ncbi:MAG: tRNA dihydrouridine synthase DusB [Candidatus Omnitrophota bacterium]